MGVRGKGHQLRTLRLNIPSREKLLAATPRLSVDPPNMSIFCTFFTKFCNILRLRAQNI